MMKLGTWFSSFVALLAMAAVYMACEAADPGPLQDFCVGVNDPHAAIFVNGLFCKNPTNVTVNDFLYRGFDTPGNTNNELGTQVMMINQTILPALNTLGVSVARIDFAPNGVNPPHSHPRASEIFTVIEGTLYVGLVTANLQVGGNKLFATVLNKGDIFVFPQGLVHFQKNIGKTNAVANVAFGSQNPGVSTVANAVFRSQPHIPVDVLAKAFQVDEKVIELLQSRSAASGNQQLLHEVC